MAPGPTPSMFHYDTRLQSFQPQSSSSKSKKRPSKPAFPLSKSTHPHLTPAKLAQAGFYHDPGDDEESADTCRCFLCGLKLGGWDAEDDPFEEHVKRGSCAWAEFVCGPVVHRAKKIKAVYLTPDTLPSSAESSTFREETYGKVWPHKQKSGWLPTVKNLSKAGFVLSATTEFKDQVLCPLCDYGVDGWEATDDPWSIHFTKSPKCPFFVAQVDGALPVDDKTPVKTRRMTKPAGARAKRATTAVSEAASQLPVDGGSGSQDPNITIGQPSKARKPRQTTRGRSKKATEEVESVVDQSEGDDTRDTITVEPPSKSKRAPRQTRAKVKKTDDEIESAIDQSEYESAANEAATEVPRPTRGRKGKQKDTDGESQVETESQVEVAEVAEVVKEKVKKPRAAKGKKKVDEVEAAESQSQVEPDSQVDEELKKPIKAKRGRPPNKSRTTSKSAANTDTAETEFDRNHASGPSASEVEMDEPQLHPPVSSRSDPAAKTKPHSSSRGKNTAKPLPPVPAETSTTHFDRFTDLPSSPYPISLHAETTPRPRDIAPKPRLSPRLPRGELDRSVVQGALEARRVMEDLLVNPNIATDAKADNGKNDHAGTDALTDDQKVMTLEQFVRAEMKKRHDVMQIQGQDMIGQWEDRTRQARRRIEGL